MRYLGGKQRIAKRIAAVIDEHRAPGQLVWDAFCGGLSVSAALAVKGPVLSSDVCLPLITLYTSFQSGWRPPPTITKEMYNLAKILPDTDPMKAFCGFGMSFGGKWFGGFTGDGVNSDGISTYSQCAVNSLQRFVLDQEFRCLDFNKLPVIDSGRIVYCDPPYRGTTSYKGVPAFDYAVFESQVKLWSSVADVFVSEFDFPLGTVVWEKKRICRLNDTVDMSQSRGKMTVERLYHIPKVCTQ